MPVICEIARMITFGGSYDALDLRFYKMVNLK